MIKKISIALVLIFWPLSLLFSNTFPDFVRYLVPTLLVIFCLFLYDKKLKYYFLPVIAIPLVEPKLALLPLLFFLISFIVKKDKSLVKYILVSLVILVFFWKPFFGQTIFKFDYQASQLALQKSHLYNSIPLARVFQNKARIPLDKLSGNFFSLIDPNNYFFGFAPRQIVVDNQNLVKLPFIAVVFIIIGLVNLNTLKRKDFLLILFISSIFTLSLLTAFDRQDFILFLPISLITIHGIEVLYKKRENLTKIILLLMIIFAIPEIIRIIALTGK